MLFALRQPKSTSFTTAWLLVLVTHAALLLLLLASSTGVPAPQTLPEHPLVVFRHPPAPAPVKARVVDSGGSGRKEAPRPRKRVQPAPRQIEAPPLAPMLVSALPMLGANLGVSVGYAESEVGPRGGSGIGSRPGSGQGTGVGRGDSKARRAWFASYDWRCVRPDNEEKAGRVVVRLRVTIEADGRPSEVKVLTPGPEVFTQRATRCASEESYLAALDDEGTPFVSAAEFGIEFLP